MNKNELLKKILPKKVDITPQGFVSLDLSNEQIDQMLDVFFENILLIKEADISEINGCGEFDENGNLPYQTNREMLTEVFSYDNEGYWYNWKEMFDTTALDKEFFTKYYNKMLELSSFIEGKRYLVNNNTFFDFMITDGKSHVGFPDWTRSGITDHLLDICHMDLEKPYLLIPEKFYAYIKRNNIEIENFKERFLCMAYFKGLDTLRWHASIDDIQSVQSIMKSIQSLEDRINNL